MPGEQRGWRTPLGNFAHYQPARLKKHPENWRLHPDAQRQVMRAVQKPIAVQRQIIEWHTKPGELVADWYMGAGAVIIACELTGRIGHGIDIAHAYLAATLERLAARGLKPRLVTQTA